MNINKNAITWFATILVVVVGLTILGLNARNNTNSNTTSTQTSNKLSEPPAENDSGRDFTFMNLDLTIDEPNGLRGLAYSTRDDSGFIAGRTYVTSEDFKAAVRACGGNPDNNFFASIVSNPNSVADEDIVTVANGQRIALLDGKVDDCSASDVAAAALQASVSESKQLLRTAFENARNQ